MYLPLERGRFLVVFSICRACEPGRERPLRFDVGGCVRDAGLRLHDLRHTFAVLQLSAGTHFMQESKWLGRSTFTLTLDTYGDYIPEQDGGALNTLPEPPAPV